MRRQRNLLGPQGMGGMVPLWGASSMVQSVQSGSTNIAGNLATATATITAINTNNCVVFMAGNRTQGNASWNAGGYYPILTVTNATTLTMTRLDGGPYGIVVNWQIVEFAPGILKSIQRGTVAMVAVGSNTATITSVDTAKSIVLGQGATWYDNSSTQSLGATSVTMTLTNATTLTVNRDVSTVTWTQGYQILEFY